MEQLAGVDLGIHIEKVLSEDPIQVRPLLPKATQQIKIYRCNHNPNGMLLKSLLHAETKGFNRLYFSNETHEYLGLYSPSSLKLSHHLEVNHCLEILSSHEDILIFGLLPFDQKRPWQGWNLPSYFICDYTLIYDRKENTLIIQKVAEENTSTSALSFTFKDSKSARLSPSTQKEYPAYGQWKNFIERSLERLNDQENVLTKIVAARTLELDFSSIDKMSSLQIFDQIKSESRYHFFLEATDQVFMGNTPECLLQANQGNFEFDALAGTRPRAQDPLEDQRLQEELFQSPKEQFEHQQVVNYITSGLEQYGEISQGDSFVLKLKSLQHIKTPLRLKARENSPKILLELIERLHPTPAVCGMPKAQAMNFLREHDPIDRGMYAGAIGILSPKYSELCVGIRSLRIDYMAKKATLYGGAGIVSDSTAHAEWEETGHKIKSFSPFEGITL